MDGCWRQSCESNKEKGVEGGVMQMEKMSEVILLITATINPRGCPGAMFKVEERINQYKRAFCFYLGKLSAGAYSKIVFCENSGYDLGEFRSLVPATKVDDVEFLSFETTDFVPVFGKSRNELLMLDKAIEKSRFLSTGDPFFFKVTGRFSILNILSFISECHQKLPALDFYCDCKDHHLFSTLHLRWSEANCDTRHIGWRVSFYRKYIYGRYVNCEPPTCRSFEQLMLSLSRANRCNPRVVHRARREIRIDGYSGHVVQAGPLVVPRDLQKYYFLLRVLVGDFLRLTLPKFWF